MNVYVFQRYICNLFQMYVYETSRCKYECVLYVEVISYAYVEVFTYERA